MHTLTTVEQKRERLVQEGHWYSVSYELLIRFYEKNPSVAEIVAGWKSSSPHWTQLMNENNARIGWATSVYQDCWYMVIYMEER